MKYVLATDTHFGHKNIVKYAGRPENHEELMEASLLVLPEEAVFLHLGDVSLGKEEYWHDRVIQKIPCRKKILVRGNHDGKSNAWYMAHGWDFVVRKFYDKMFGKYIEFSHMPQPVNEKYDMNIHGHFHNNDHRRCEPEFQALYCQGYHQLIAMENMNYRPVWLEELLKARGFLD